MTPSELVELDDADLQEYFEQNAGYFEQNPPKSQYGIRFGARSLFSNDTKDLRDKFFRKVRSYKPAATDQSKFCNTRLMTVPTTGDRNDNIIRTSCPQRSDASVVS